MTNELKEALNCTIEHLEGEHEGKVVVDRDVFEVLYDAAQAYAKLEPILKELVEARGEDEYYIRRKPSGFLGNSPVWWAKEGKGYTAYILGAERFSKEDADKLVDEDPEKWEAYKCCEVDKRLHLVFDMQDSGRLGTDEPCSWSSGYAAPLAANRINDIKQIMENKDD